MNVIDEQDFQPLDPGRVNLADPVELKYWCRHLSCKPDRLASAVQHAGAHVTAVREWLKSNPV